MGTFILAAISLTVNNSARFISSDILFPPLCFSLATISRRITLSRKASNSWEIVFKASGYHVVVNSQLPGAQPVQDLSPTESRFLKRLKEDWASLEAMKKLVNGGCEPAIIYWLLSAYWIGPEIKALEEHREATRSLKEIFEGLDKHLSAACEEIAKMQELPEYPEVFKLFLPIQEFRDAVKNVVPELVETADKRGRLRRELWLTAALLYVEKHLKQPCFPQVSQLLDCFAVAEGEESEPSPDSIRKIHDRYRQRGQANVLLAESALRFWPPDAYTVGVHIRRICAQTGRQESSIQRSDDRAYS